MNPEILLNKAFTPLAVLLVTEPRPLPTVKPLTLMSFVKFMLSTTIGTLVVIDDVKVPSALRYCADVPPGTLKPEAVTAPLVFTFVTAPFPN